MKAGELGFGVVDLRGREVEDRVGFKGAVEVCTVYVWSWERVHL